jgi:hypothetical protein
MKEEEQKNIHQKQLLINRLYKNKNTQNVNKPTMKNNDDTKLLFYVWLFLKYCSKPRRSHFGRRKKIQDLKYCPGSDLARNLKTKKESTVV